MFPFSSSYENCFCLRGRILRALFYINKSLCLHVHSLLEGEGILLHFIYGIDWSFCACPCFSSFLRPVLQLLHLYLLVQYLLCLFQFQISERQNLIGPRMATYPSILAWRIPWTEGPGGLQSMGLQRARQDKAHTHAQPLETFSTSQVESGKSETYPRTRLCRNFEALVKYLDYSE